MKPRLKTSKKWTAFPEEYQAQILTVFQQEFGPRLPKGEFVVEGRIYSEEILLRVGFREEKRLHQDNFEVSVGFNASKDNGIQVIYDCIDVVASLMQDFVESQGAGELPREWTEHTFEKRTVYVQHSAVNTKLEAEADKLLGVKSDDLVHEEEDEEIDESPEEEDESLEVDEEIDADEDEDFEDDNDDDDDEEDEEPSEEPQFKKPKKPPTSLH